MGIGRCRPESVEKNLNRTKVGKVNKLTGLFRQAFVSSSTIIDKSVQMSVNKLKWYSVEILLLSAHFVEIRVEEEVLYFFFAEENQRR